MTNRNTPPTTVYYAHPRYESRHLMYQTALACLPGLLVQGYLWGWGTLLQLCITLPTALGAEGWILYLRRHPITPQLADGSALLTALLLALALPPLAPWWLTFIATCAAIVIAKQCYGGLGQNLFNPAMVGYLVVFISFSTQMQQSYPTLRKPSWQESCAAIFKEENAFLTDSMAQATPLTAMKILLHSDSTDQKTRPMTTTQTSLENHWCMLNAAFLLGGIWLLHRGVIRYIIPLSLLLTLAIVAAIGWYYQPLQGSPSFHLRVGATALGAFFIATDPITAATSVRGQVLFGALIGLLIYCIRTVGSYPDGVAFAVLLGNVNAPLIDYFTRPQVYGTRKNG